MDKIICGYTMYVIAYVKHNLNIEILKKSLRYVAEDIPSLSRKLSKGYWRDKWIPIENFDIGQIIETIRVTKDSFYDKAYLKFIQLQDKQINLEDEPPLKIKIFYNEEIEKKVLVFCIHHSIADGRGTFQLIKLIGDYYNDILHDRKLKRQKNYSKIQMRMLSFNIITKIYKNFKEFIQSPKKVSMEPLLEMEDINDDEKSESIEKITINKEDLYRLKLLYKDFTINDIIALLTLKLSIKYNKTLKKSSSYVGLGISVDLRKYIKKDILSITNYASMNVFKARIEDVNNLTKMAENFKKFKENALGFIFYFDFVADILPVSIQRNMVNKWLKDSIISKSIFMFQTTNIGRLDDSLTPFGDIIENVSFVGPSPRYGFPLISLSGYKDTLTIYFTKYNDENNLSKKIRHDFNELLQETLDYELVNNI